MSEVCSGKQTFAQLRTGLRFCTKKNNIHYYHFLPTLLLLEELHCTESIWTEFSCIMHCNFLPTLLLSLGELHCTEFISCILHCVFPLPPSPPPPPPTHTHSPVTSLENMFHRSWYRSRLASNRLTNTLANSSCSRDGCIKLHTHKL